MVPPTKEQYGSNFCLFPGNDLTDQGAEGIVSNR
jgi:hypothetical protein